MNMLRVAFIIIMFTALASCSTLTPAKARQHKNTQVVQPICKVLRNVKKYRNRQLTVRAKLLNGHVEGVMLYGVNCPAIKVAMVFAPGTETKNSSVLTNALIHQQVVNRSWIVNIWLRGSIKMNDAGKRGTLVFVVSKILRVTAN